MSDDTYWECPDHQQHCSCHVNPPCDACVTCETCAEYYGEDDDE